ncbi:uncharacterized protein G2W53_044285 [Senna tora]|uniref:Uncharacterized protein n=1 Tax=Senna tora TaxID=362788 RepID=A0A834W5R3_9FABA|nr:uncharacterized protein G2W53_044285 [Senna tora]
MLKSGCVFILDWCVLMRKGFGCWRLLIFPFFSDQPMEKAVKERAHSRTREGEVQSDEDKLVFSSQFHKIHSFSAAFGSMENWNSR